MAWWKKRAIENTGTVLFRGKLPPRAENFAYLTELGLTLTEGEQTDGAHWTLAARHPDWGDARIVCLRDAPMPPQELVQHDPRLLDEERELTRLAGSSVSVSLTQRSQDVLLERKRLLRYLRAIMGDDGLVAVDHTAQAFWSRADLDDELAHDAELDVLSLFTVHSVSDEAGRVSWMHSHGLHEIGHFDFDLIEPSPDLDNVGAWDLIRALAFAIVEGNAEVSGAPFKLVGGAPPVRFVPSKHFRAQSGAEHSSWVEMLDDGHLAGHAVVCEPDSKLLGLFARKARPSRWLSGPLGEDMPLQFSDSASDLMARRARATWKMFHDARGELEGLELPFLAKLRYEDISKGSAEHLWFEVHSINADTMDATLVNEPFGEIGIALRQRATHDLARLSDWAIVTPFGMVTPRSTRQLRQLRERRVELAEILREARRRPE